MSHCRIGTRGSLLALTQTKMVQKALQEQFPQDTFEIIIYKTSGDLDQKTPLSQMGGMGVFVKELEIGLLNREIDLAVHSLKDVPHTIPTGLEISAYFNREDARDVLISNQLSLSELKQGATVGTGSPRRICQLRHLRPDLKFVELRGNIDTRIQKVHTGELDGIILAAAGLHRLDKKDVITEYLATEKMLPAIAQGIVAIESRSDDLISKAFAKGVESLDAALAARLERELMVSLGGGCKSPMAAYAQKISTDEWQLELYLASPDGLKDFRLCLKDTYDSLLPKMLNLTEEKAKDLGIPLPKELPEHHLLKNPIS